MQDVSLYLSRVWQWFLGESTKGEGLKCAAIKASKHDTPLVFDFKLSSKNRLPIYHIRNNFDTGARH